MYSVLGLEYRMHQFPVVGHDTLVCGLCRKEVETVPFPFMANGVCEWL